MVLTKSSDDLSRLGRALCLLVEWGREAREKRTDDADEKNEPTTGPRDPARAAGLTDKRRAVLKK